jgi:hypothetical protein
VTSTSPCPTIGVIRLGWAALLLAAPSKVLAAFGGPADSTSVTVARVLGARHAIQGAVEVAAWPRWRRSSSVIDAAHSLTAVALSASDRRWRRLARTDGLIAAAFAVGGLAGRRPTGESHTHELSANGNKHARSH